MPMICNIILCIALPKLNNLVMTQDKLLWHKSTTRIGIIRQRYFFSLYLNPNNNTQSVFLVFCPGYVGIEQS